MLTELKTVMQWYLDEPDEAWQFDEIVFGKVVREALAGLDMDIVVHASSVRIRIDSNYCHIPSQYLLYAIKIRPLATLIQRYMDVFEELKGQLSERPENLKEYISSKSEDRPATSSLDHLSRENFFSVFSDAAARGKAKSIFNVKDGTCRLRSVPDVFGSIVLKSLPVPDNSSVILGRLVHELVGKPDVYELLENELSRRLPYIISAETADELLFRLFFILPAKDCFDTLFTGHSDAGDMLSVPCIDDLFLLKEKPVAGNIGYFDEPLAYQYELARFVYLKKGLLATNEGRESVNEFLRAVGQRIEVRWREPRYIVCDRSMVSGKSRVTGGLNRIYFGAPGTGKSHSVDQLTASGIRFVTVFHADTQYSDFAGSLKPVMRGAGDRRTISYEFRPGKFTTALIEALNNPEKIVYLVVEEINRAPAASVFGEIFQLLDRQACGESRYGITLSDPDMERYISEHASVFDGILRIPSNLSILATMNSSDQSVMPMDTAFKRRWLFEYLPIDYEKTANGNFDVMFSGGVSRKVPWKSFSKAVNEALSAAKVPEDRLLGHRFVSEHELRDGDTSNETLISKVLVYLWDDVLRHGRRDSIFRLTSGVIATGTFGQLSSAFRNGQAVFSSDFEERLLKELEEPDVDSDAVDDVEAK